MENVPQASPYERVVPWGQLPPRQQARAPRRRPKKKPSQYFNSLSRMVEDTHLDLLTRKSPLRLCVYKNNQAVFMDVVTLDGLDKIDHEVTKRITDDDMDILVKRIHNRMGLILDYVV